MSTLPLSGRTALVTGANTGIGRAAALALGRAGADVIVHHHGDEAGALGTRETLAAAGRRATVLAADFLAGGAEALAEAALAEGPVDILIANAAIEVRVPWQEADRAHIDRHVAANFASLLALAGRLVPPMAARGFGRVVAIGSVLAARPRAETVVYAAMKSAQLTAVRALCREVAGQGVTMNVVSPGAIETEATAARYADPVFRAAVGAKIPAARPGLPEDVAGIVTFLASDAAAYITGADIPVDGGWSAGDAPIPLPSPQQQ